MNSFRDYMKLILESVVAPGEYDFPKDKLTQLYDFYLANYPFGAGKKESVLAYSKAAEGIDAALAEAKDKITKSLQESILGGVLLAISAELRHAFHHTSDSYDKLRDMFMDHGWTEKQVKTFNNVHSNVKSKEAEKELKKRMPDEAKLMRSADGLERYKSYAYLIKNFTPRQIVELAQEAFKKLNWESDYGGKNWKNIADAWIRLDDAKTVDQRSIAIDHIMDLQHNNDTVFNKLQTYYRNDEHHGLGGGYDWLQKFLTFKKYVDSPWKLYDKASPSMKKIAAAVGKIHGEKSFVDWSEERDTKAAKKTNLTPEKLAALGYLNKLEKEGVLAWANWILSSLLTLDQEFMRQFLNEYGGKFDFTEINEYPGLKTKIVKKFPIIKTYL